MRGHMPYRAECMREDSGVIFFRTEDNPFQPKKEIERVLKSETESQKRCRAYGYVEQTQAGFFEIFKRTQDRSQASSKLRCCAIHGMRPGRVKDVERVVDRC